MFHGSKTTVRQIRRCHHGGICILQEGFEDCKIIFSTYDRYQMMWCCIDASILNMTYLVIKWRVTLFEGRTHVSTRGLAKQN